MWRIFRFLIYLAMTGTGILMTAGWIFFGGRQIGFTVGSFLSAFGFFSFWIDFILPKQGGT
jgi:hypothetical protein